MKRGISDWIMFFLGAYNPGVIYNKAVRKCDKWNTLYGNGKRCENCKKPSTSPNLIRNLDLPLPLQPLQTPNIEVLMH